MFLQIQTDMHVYINTLLTHAFKQNKKLDDLVQDNCFASQSFMLPKVTATTKDIENKELSI